MYSKRFIVSALVGFVFFLNLGAQNIDPNYKVGTWRGFTDAAITYTFDDNCPNQYAIAIPVLNEFGFNATFYPVTNWGPQWAKFKAAAALGHEIGSHTVTHTSLATLDTTKQEEELKNSKAQVESQVSGENCLTIAYPYCVPSVAALTREYYIAARHCQGQVERTTPTDFYNISSIICGEVGSVKTTAHFIAKEESAAKTRGWVVYLIHGMNGDGGYSSLDSVVFRESLAYLDENREKYWVSTFANVVRYIRERNSISITETAAADTFLQIEVTDTLDNSVYNYPVSVRRTLPAGWHWAGVFQDNVAVPFKVFELNSELVIEFDVVPDAGTILVNKADFAVSQLNSKISSIKIHPNPFQGGIQITSAGDFNYEIFTMTGKLVSRGKSSGKETVGESFDPGVYFLNVKSGNEVLSRKIVKL